MSEDLNATKQKAKKPKMHYLAILLLVAYYKGVRELKVRFVRGFQFAYAQYHITPEHAQLQSPPYPQSVAHLHPIAIHVQASATRVIQAQ